MTKPLIQWFNQRQSLHCHRQLLRIVGSQDWACQTVATMLSDQQHVLWVSTEGKFLPTNHTVINNKQYRQHLGVEYDYVVYDSYAGTRANALIALSGTIKRGGLMIEITPPDEEWEYYADPELNQQTSEFFRDQCLPNHFVSWLLHQLAHDPTIVTFNGDRLTGQTQLISSTVETDDQAAFSSNTPYFSDQQKHVVDTIVKLAHSAKPSPVVITADRGRGKSTALGLAARQLITEGMKDIIITGPTPDACLTALTHSRDLGLSSEPVPSTGATHQACIRFVPFDELLKQAITPALLMVDEAAAIPVTILKQLLKQSKRVVFSSTIHGYEGTGRGFELRFKPYLNELTPNWLHLNMTTPARWHRDDCLEQFWFRAMLFCENHHDTIHRTANAATNGTHTFKGQDLVQHPLMLYQAFNLLINSHYQTSPDDLQRLVTCPEYQMIITVEQNQVVGATLVVEEPNLLSELGDKIVLGQRRIKGFLSAQTVGFQHGTTTAFAYSFLRVVRIAVKPNFRRKGIATTMLQQAKALASEKSFHFLSTSYGLTPDLLDFWREQSFELINIGLHQDAVTGEYSGLCLHPIDHRANQWLSDLAKESRNKFQYQLPRTYNSMSPDLVAKIIQAHPSLQIESLIVEKVRYFIDGQRPLATAQYELAVYLFHALSKVVLRSDATPLLVETLLQHHDLKHIATALNLSGKKELERQVRTHFEDLFAKLHQSVFNEPTHTSSPTRRLRQGNNSF